MRRSIPVLILALVALVAAGCGDDDEPGGETSAPRTRSVTHAMGTTEVPVAPERVVVLDSPFLDAALSLGVTPVATVEASAGAGAPEYVADRVPDIEIVGLITEPNVEAIAAVRPDLILGAKVRHEALYDSLSDIAPTVFTESSGTNWKEGLAITADALGAVDAAEELVADHEERAASIGEQIGASTMRASIVRFLLPEQIRLYGPDTFSGTVLTDVGFDLGDHGWNEYSMALLSAEELGRADADVVFSTAYGGDESTEFSSVFAPVEPLWRTIPAVADGRQHWVNDRVWMLGIGPIGADQILDDVESILVEG